MIEETLDHGFYAEFPSADKSPDSQLTTLFLITEISPVRTEVLVQPPRSARDLTGRIKPGLLI